MNKLPGIFPLILLLINLSEFPVYGESGKEEFIEIELWTEISKTVPAANDENSKYLTDNELARRILEDAAWIISGMIYGFDVVYTPKDTARRVEEYLKVSPVASIPWGDKNLEITDSWNSNGKLQMQIRYYLGSGQITRKELWNSNIFPDAEGVGTVSIFEGYQGRKESVKEGIKDALRNYLRLRYTNKPREINARVLINNPPYTILDAGGYKSRVNITIKFTEIVPYAYY
ncbi:MAG: hypothetical protein L3J12_06550 [Spirochaetales bacterium]|nr:hypothetical protein [Spirochaetales bacterium]